MHRPLDTSPEAWERYFDLLRQISPARRLETACAHSDSLRKLVMAGLRGELPDAPEEELRRRLAERLYGLAPPGAQSSGTRLRVTGDTLVVTLGAGE